MKYYLISLSIFLIATFLGKAQDNQNQQRDLNTYKNVVQKFVPELIDAAMENYFSQKSESTNEIAGRDSFKILFKGKADWEKSKLSEFLNTHSWGKLNKNYAEDLIDKYMSMEGSIVDEQSAKIAIDSLAKYNPKKFLYYSPKAIEIALNSKNKITPTVAPKLYPTVGSGEPSKTAEKAAPPYIFIVLVFLLFISSVILFVLLLKANKKVGWLNSKLKDTNKSTEVISKRDYMALLNTYKELEKEHGNLKIKYKVQIETQKKFDTRINPFINKTESENKKELNNKEEVSNEEEVSKEVENKIESNGVKSVDNQSKQFLPEYFFFDEFNSGIFKDKAKSESHKCVYKISTTASSNDIIELLVDKITMPNYIINKNIYLPEYICSIKYISGGTQTKIQNIIPGKVRLENGEWKIQDKIELEII
jgi:hypothetical protein